MRKSTLWTCQRKADDSSAPDAPWFAACQPDAPCITPGTYAYLGAAAALR